MAVTMTTPVKRSWADIVKGCAPSMPPSELEANFAIDVADENSVKPGMRGQRRCLCQGEILVMLGHYGWIMTFDPVDHPDVWKTAGRVYVHKRDVAKGTKLRQGDTVSFYLYADDQGLGAEGVQLEQRAPANLCADAEEFSLNDLIPEKARPGSGWNLGAAEFVPAPVTTLPGFGVQVPEVAPGFNVLAPDFVPGGVSMGPPDDVKEFVPTSKGFGSSGKEGMSFLGIEINPAFLSDDESDDESTVCDDNSSGIDDSTAACSSESEAEDTCASVRPPPGLSLPPGFRPPPGLELQLEEA